MKKKKRKTVFVNPTNRVKSGENSLSDAPLEVRGEVGTTFTDEEMPLEQASRWQPRVRKRDAEKTTGSSAKSVTRLKHKTSYLLCIAPDTCDSSGFYPVDLLEPDELVKYFDYELIGDQLNKTVAHLYGSGKWFDVTRFDVDTDAYAEDGKVFIHNACGSGKLISITDISSRILVPPGVGVMGVYIVINEPFTEYRWIICMAITHHTDSE